MDKYLEAVTLRGRHVQLEPLALEHLDALIAAAIDGELWRLWYTQVPPPQRMRAYIGNFLARKEKGESLPFAVRNLHTGAVIGHTAFYEIVPEYRRLALGYTWYAASAQRTAINTESKRLLLEYAFETLQCVRVEFHTHWLNHRSRQAIERLGAKQEGVLRSHRILPDGTLRDTVMFSIIEPEWPAIGQHLQFLLDSYSS
ncbi:MAG: GNAT family N-acetyltransferase [Xanthomonadaceae bacterium]|nr:GNAT family N-acetyltransferase [Xanthomonadaceae bacterium]